MTRLWKKMMKILIKIVYVAFVKKAFKEGDVEVKDHDHIN